jgi:hypothetical protein
VPGAPEHIRHRDDGIGMEVLAENHGCRPPRGPAA